MQAETELPPPAMPASADRKALNPHAFDRQDIECDALPIGGRHAGSIAGLNGDTLQAEAS